MNLNKLRTFIHVAEQGSITQAAQNLFRTQPAISSALKDLEEEMGLKLFERRNAKIFLTPQGKELYDFSHQLIRELDDKADRMCADMTKLSGTIRLGILNDFSTYLSAGLVAGLRQQFPLVNLRLYSQSREQLEASMLSGELDYALMTAYGNRELFETVPFITFTGEPMASPAYLKRVSAISNPENILNRDFVVVGESIGSFRSWFRENELICLESEALKLKPSISVGNTNDLNRLVVQGIGVGLCYRELVQTEINRRQLVRLFPGYDPVRVVVDISRRKVRSNSFLMETFWEYMLERISIDS